LSNGEPTYKKIIRGIEKCLENDIIVRIRVNVDISNFDEGNRLQDNLQERFSKYSDFLEFEMSPLMGASDAEKNHLISEMHRSVIDCTPEEKIRKNHLFPTMSPTCTVPN